MTARASVAIAWRQSSQRRPGLVVQPAGRRPDEAALGDRDPADRELEAERQPSGSGTGAPRPRGMRGTGAIRAT
jgi:hypothetical protein